MGKNAKQNADATVTDQAVCERVCESPAPDGANGADAEPVCKCGATSRNRTGERCANGHLLPENTASLLVGERSVQFWAAAEDAHREIVTQALADAGHTPACAPRTLTITAEGLAQATLLRDSAYDRLKRLGGPLSSSNDRARRAFTVWESAAASVERHVKLLGLKRRQKHVDPMVALRAAVERANGR
jgi:hypothetical protein